MNQIIPYPTDILDLLTAEGFEKQFWALYASADWKSREKCYEVLEAKREMYFNKRYYTEYDSFRKSIAYHHNKRKQAA